MRLLPLLLAAPLALLGLAGPFAVPSPSLHAASDEPPPILEGTIIAEEAFMCSARRAVNGEPGL